MGVIKQLPESVSNQISAGEVIERPASIVKELIENSIDAGSTQILIEVEKGGREMIRVKDNGSGIAEDDMELAFYRYATSKIENVNDLYSIRTLGFRGEALASIASVSKLKITSRTDDSLKGTLMKLEAGTVVKKEPVGAQTGTDIIIEDIFFNTPARYKYLKTINTEFAHISSVVSRESLAYPEIKFTLIHNGSEVLRTPGSGNLIDVIYSIYGQEMTDNLIPIEYEESYISISGYIAKPGFNRSSRIYELFFVNNRAITNTCLNHGVEKGYHGLLAPGRYPVCFIKLKLNQILVDVNVHPSKREIHFSREEIVENVIKKGVKKTLSELNVVPKFKIKKNRDNSGNKIEIKQLDFEDKNSDNKFSENKFMDKSNNENYSEISNNENYSEISNSGNYSEVNKDTYSNEDSNYSLDGTPLKANNLDQDRRENNYNRGRGQENNDRVTETARNYSREKYEKNLNKNTNLPDNIKKIFGQINNTYILVEGIDGLYIVDQHNAHERVLYENYYEKYNQQNILTQSLLIPVTVEITLEEKEIVNKYLDDLKAIGIMVEPFGNSSVIITEIPQFIKNISPQVIIRDLIDNLIEKGKTMENAEMIDTIISYMSCRGAIKAGKHLDYSEMHKLINDIFAAENKNRCPHGRPIIVHLSNDDIAKSMGR